MEAVDVDQIDAAVRKRRQRGLERTPQQPGEFPVPAIVVGEKFLVNLATVVPRVFVALPMINAEAPRIETEPVDGLQEGAVGIAGVDAKLDNHARLERAY